MTDMDRSPEADRDSIMYRVRRLVEYVNEFAKDSAILSRAIADGPKKLLDVDALDELSIEALRDIDDSLKDLVLNVIAAEVQSEAQLRWGHEAFLQQLISRQGSRPLDFDKLYRDREKLDRQLEGPDAE